jgi:hypothetical protein
VATQRVGSLGITRPTTGKCHVIISVKRNIKRRCSIVVSTARCGFSVEPSRPMFDSWHRQLVVVNLFFLRPLAKEGAGQLPWNVQYTGLSNETSSTTTTKPQRQKGKSKKESREKLQQEILHRTVFIGIPFTMIAVSVGAAANQSCGRLPTPAPTAQGLCIPTLSG